MRTRMTKGVLGVCFCVSLCLCLLAARPSYAAADLSEGDRMIGEYFRAETARLADRCLDDIKTLEDWKGKRPIYRKQLLEMLALDPMPAKGALKAEVTGTVEHEEFTVENVHFQSMPGLYVTGNLYIPKDRQARADDSLRLWARAGQN